MKITDSAGPVGIPHVERYGSGREEDYFTTTVYNLEVEDFHTYYVTEGGLWVHNKNVNLLAKTVDNKVPMPGYVPTADELKNAFQSRAELNAYLRLNAKAAEASSEAFIVRSTSTPEPVQRRIRTCRR